MNPAPENNVASLDTTLQSLSLNGPTATDDVDSVTPSPTDAPAGPRHIVVDTLNYLNWFLPATSKRYKQSEPWVLLNEAHKRVRHFLDSCRRQNIVPHFVIDIGFSSEEVAETWRQRRVKEVNGGFKTMPYNADSAIGALLTIAGADVLRPLGVDADDAVATLAVELGADVLSGDSDFLRYPGLPHDRLFDDLEFERGRITFVRRTNFVVGKYKAHLPPRKLLPLPCDVASWRESNAKLLGDLHASPESGLMLGTYVRGNADGLTKRCGNLHAIATPIRRAVYKHIDVEAVHETYPVWDAEKERAAWFEGRIHADDSEFADELEPDTILRYLTERDTVEPPCTHTAAWRRHAREAMAAELYCAALSSRTIVDELRVAATLASKGGNANAKRLLGKLR